MSNLTVPDTCHNVPPCATMRHVRHRHGRHGNMTTSTITRPTNREVWASLRDGLDQARSTLGWDHPDSLRWEFLEELASAYYLAAPDQPFPVDLDAPEVSLRVEGYLRYVQAGA